MSGMVDEVEQERDQDRRRHLSRKRESCSSGRRRSELTAFGFLLCCPRPAGAEVDISIRDQFPPQPSGLHQEEKRILHPQFQDRFEFLVRATCWGLVDEKHDGGAQGTVPGKPYIAVMPEA